MLVTVYNVFVSIRKGRPAGPDPWRANTLEWFTPSAAADHNFDVDPDGAQPRADEGHPARGAAARGRALQRRDGNGATPHVTEPGKQPEPL